MIVTVHQPQYLPWLGYFDKADRADQFILLDDVQYKKNDWQNRNKIRTAQGWQWLTVPVLSNFGQTINEVKINTATPWRRTHLNAIKLNYVKSKYLKDYLPVLEDIYHEDWQMLVDLNVVLIEQIIRWLGITTRIVRSSAYEATPESTQRLVDLCQHLQASTYLSGADGEKYLDFERFTAQGIRVEIQNYRHPSYQQLWCKETSDFYTHLSIFDLLFNHGPESLEILRNTSERRWCD
jgi:hypothetical protein